MKFQKMPTKIIYAVVDDEKGERVRPYLDALQSAAKKLELSSHQPEKFEDEVETLGKSQFDGLILDLRLGDRKNEKTGEKARYTAQGLAQELRSWMIQQSDTDTLNSVPIVLWSSDANLNKFYRRDDTAHDLFDAVYSKPDIVEQPNRIANELVDLAAGYERVRDADLSTLKSRKDSFKTIYGIYRSDIPDPRTSEALDFSTNPSVHEVARSTLSRLILPQGPLVSEAVIAARLGIDRQNSSDWEKVLKRISSAKYTGIFGEAWPRWWWHLIQNWWSAKISDEIDLMSSPAEERVNCLTRKLKMKKLKSALPAKHNLSTKFWTVCLATEQPLDPAEGIRANIEEREPWQDVGYLSLTSILDRVASEKNLKVHPLDRERFSALKEQTKT